MATAEGAYLFKVVLMGEPEVGKTSLVRRYVRHAFDEGYTKTIGTEVSRRTEVVPTADGRPLHVKLDVWDVMGQRLCGELVREAYFLGSQGALGVFDVTRPETLVYLYDWIRSARRQEPAIKVLVLGNKVDLADARRVADAEAREFCERLHLPYVPTSAKSGLNVEAAFRLLAEQILGRVAPLEFPRAADA